MNLEDIELYHNNLCNIENDSNYSNFQKIMINFNEIYDFYSNKNVNIISEKIFVNRKIDELVTNIFNEYNLQKLYSNLSLKNYNLSELDAIIDDDNIVKSNCQYHNNGENYKTSFLNSIKRIENNKKIEKQDLLFILLFINQIRNNVFHGIKPPRQILEDLKQNERLGLYCKIVFEVNKICIDEFKRKGY